MSLIYLFFQGVMQMKTKLSQLNLSSGSLKKAAAIDAYFQREIIHRRNIRMARRIAELARYNVSPLASRKDRHGNVYRKRDMWFRRSPVFVALGAGELVTASFLPGRLLKYRNTRAAMRLFRDKCR